MRRRGWRTYRLLMALCVKLQIQEQEPSEPSPKPALTNPSQAASIKTTVNILLTHTRGTTAASQIIIRDYMADALCLIRQVETVIPYRYHPAQVRRVFSPLRLLVSGAGEGDENIIQVLTSS
ncbi:hypothetical protein T01_11304 [Trichinella spiralis]|uniref:Uncharacterized protein n=1 Tax=Trichinella spiralis TaxID=6334 RepID=A0A0V1B4Y6_TRISP|nr:hypothetical protein T01_11304 [Trichinella spiralis]